jgi:hypothetical protein
MVDLGDADAKEVGAGPTLRITPRGRAFLAESPGELPLEPTTFVDNEILRIGSGVPVGAVIALAPFVEIGRVSGQLDVSITPQTLSQALSAGYEGEVIKARLESVAPLPDPIARLLVQASAVIGRAEFVATQGFLWVEDPEIRELLRTRRQSADLFVDPSPPAGLLIAAGVDIDRVARRCRALGVEVIVEGEIYKTRTVSPPGRGGSGARKMDSTSAMKAQTTQPRPRRSSSASMPAVKRGE